jgi:glycosyltransferase involved in cell wall biosynthesis
MKKILIIHHHKKFGGSSKSIGEYVLSLKKSFDFEILCPYGSALDYFKEKKIKTISLPGISGVNITEIGCYKGLRLILLIRELYYFFSTYYFLRKIIKQNYDLIHLNDSNLIILAPIINNLFKKKIVCHIRTRLDNSNYLFKNMINKISKKYIYQFICIDKTTYSTSFHKNKSVIIYNIFDKKKIKLKKKKKLFFTIGFIGTLDFHKGFDFLMEITKQLYKKDKKINFLIAGKLSVDNFFLRKILNFLKIKKDIKSTTKNYLDQKNCTFLGNIVNLEKFYKQIDVIAFPSRMNALGRPVIEASSFGIPSIVCLDKVYDDTMQKHKTGIIVKFGNIKSFMKAIFKYKNNYKLRKKNGENALRLHNTTHNYTINVNKLVKLYKSII